jgi:hypothetical protein
LILVLVKLGALVVATAASRGPADGNIAGAVMAIVEAGTRASRLGVAVELGVPGGISLDLADEQKTRPGKPGRLRIRATVGIRTHSKGK